MTNGSDMRVYINYVYHGDTIANVIVCVWADMNVACLLSNSLVLLSTTHCLGVVLQGMF